MQTRKKILLNFNFEVDYKHKMRIIETFQRNGFNVTDWLLAFATEITSAALLKADYVFSINESVFFHQSFFGLLQSYIDKEVKSISVENILYTNAEQGVLVCLKNSFFAFQSKLLLNNDWDIITANQVMKGKTVLIAKEIGLEEFIKKQGFFYKEFVTAEMYENGNWGFETSGDNSNGIKATK